MLYVFLVNTGSMMTFDMELALETVENLRSAIAKTLNIDPSQQVLLISGGDSLNSKDRVCKYTSAGTDTSPIFLFSKIPIELPSIQDMMGPDDVVERVESCLQMEPSFNTVLCRTEMAHHVHDTDEAIIHSCEKMLHDQHLQHQGWASAVCNLDDIVHSFTKKANLVVEIYREVLKNKTHYHQLLDNFDSDKETLKRIPLLKSLDLLGDFSDCEEISLFDWIQQKDSKTPIDELFCRNDLMQFDEESLAIIEDDILSINKLCQNDEMIQIKGLETRLSALDKLMVESKRHFEKQGVLNETFNHNQSRASGLNDTSVLPDLCRTHADYLNTMVFNHRELLDYRYRFVLARRELADNIHLRLKWIIHVEEKLKNADDELMRVGFRLSKVREKLEIIQSLHLSAEIYLSSVAEVYRRKQFSAKFYRWAQETSEYSRKIVESETCQRRLFTSVIDKHFIKLFFPGMDDLPSNFAVPPKEFDKNLPQVNSEDLDYLIERLPEMKRLLKIGSTFEIPSFDFDRNVTAQSDSPQISQPKVPHFDQETITSILGEDIEAMNKQCNQTEERLKDKESELKDLVKKMEQLEIEDESKKNFIEKFYLTRSEIASTLHNIKSQLVNDLKSQQISFKEYLDSLVKEINERLINAANEFEESNSNLLSDVQNKEDKITELSKIIDDYENHLETKKNQLITAESKIADINNLILSQECELENLRSLADQRKESNLKSIEKVAEACEQVKQFRDQNNFLKEMFKKDLFSDMPKLCENVLNTLQNLNENILLNNQKADEKENLQKMLEEKENEIEKIRLDHRNEIESLKHRFKLAINTTSIHRTDSDTSLEKVQLDIVDHSAVEKEMQKLSQALHDKKIEYEQSLLKMKNEYDNRMKSLRAEFEREKMNNSIIIDGQEQIIQKLKSYENIFTTVLSHLQTDNELTPDEIQQKLNSLKALITNYSVNLESIPNSQSFIAIPNVLESPTQQPIEWFTSQFQQLSSDHNFTADDRVNLNSCEIGDNVFVHFHPKYQQFAVFQKNSYLHFVHNDSIREFEFNSSENDSGWFIAKVLEKDFCMTKKAENRYNLPLDTKFFRVRVRQLTKFIPNSMFECIEQAFNMSQSIATSTPSTSNNSVRNPMFGETSNTDLSSMSHSVNLGSNSKRTF